MHIADKSFFDIIVSMGKEDSILEAAFKQIALNRGVPLNEVLKQAEKEALESRETDGTNHNKDLVKRTSESLKNPKE